jgi:hypothetical protein
MPKASALYEHKISNSVFSKPLCSKYSIDNILSHPASLYAINTVYLDLALAVLTFIDIQLK